MTRPAAPDPEPGAAPPGLFRQLWRSVFRHDLHDTSKNRLAVMVSNLLLHLHPPRVRRADLRLSATLCAGGLALLMFLVTLASGILLMFHYRPHPDAAFGDLLVITQQVPHGALVRAVHRYAGDMMIILTLVHLVRVLVQRAYRAPREFNWVVGVLLLLLTLATAFTGYLLPYNQHGYWATTVAGEMVAAAPLLGAEGPFALLGPELDLRAALLGGATVGPATLVRFYVLHCLALPLAAALLMGLHFWRVRKDGFSGGL